MAGIGDGFEDVGDALAGAEIGEVEEEDVVSARRRSARTVAAERGGGVASKKLGMTVMGFEISKVSMVWRRRLSETVVTPPDARWRSLMMGR